jgi:hypothetical protein
MLLLVLVRTLISRRLVKRSTVHNNGDGDVNVRFQSLHEGTLGGAV